jgi:phage head maturation protease
MASRSRAIIRHLTRVDLWEISVVTFPLLPEARIAHVKARRPRPLGMCTFTSCLGDFQ